MTARTVLFMIGSLITAIITLIAMLLHIGRFKDHRWEITPRFAGSDRPVSIVYIEDHDSWKVREALRASLDSWGGRELLSRLLAERGHRVVIKPNFAGGRKDCAGTQTSPIVLKAIVDLLKDIDPAVQIEIVESGSIIWWALGPLLKGSPYQEIFNLPGVRFVHLGHEARVRHDFGGRMGMEDVPACLLRPSVLINAAVAKTHFFYTMSGAVKNLFGLMPDHQKLLRYHTKGFADLDGRIFLDIYRNFPPDLVIIDGIVSSEGHGPVSGTPIKTNFLITADDAVCADFILARVIGIPPREIPYLKAVLDDGCECSPALTGPRPEDMKPVTWNRAKFWAGSLANVDKIIKEHVNANRRLDVWR